jgi:hypothetical protein
MKKMSCWVLSSLVIWWGCTDESPAADTSFLPDSGKDTGIRPGDQTPSTGLDADVPADVQPDGAIVELEDGPDAGEPEAGQPDAGFDPDRLYDLDRQQQALLLQSELEALESLTTEQLQERYRVPYEQSLGYDPGQAVGLELLQASNLSLQPEELDLLEKNGFVILESYQFPSFFYAYLNVYGEDLPVYVSADSVLDAMHRSFDDILAGIERVLLVSRLGELLQRIRAEIPTAPELGEQVRADLELYFAVAQGLLEQAVPVPLAAGVTEAEVDLFLQAANQADGIQDKELFGVWRKFDFSQFKPRGHYEGDPVLEPYFRAMMWLGRIDFRLLETQGDGSQVFNRRQLEAVVALRSLVRDEALLAWEEIDATVTAFVGEHDYMVLPQVDELLANLGADSLADLAPISDQALAQAIADGEYGVQRIASHVIVKGPGSLETLPLNASFAFLGQRYTVDSHVFSNLVFDRVGNGTIMRWLPDPLDAAFAALGNDHAASLLDDELTFYGYAPDLASMRLLVDAHPAEYWHGSLYTHWLNALRALSPSAEDAAPSSDGLPAVARTEPWARRILNTQLGSWSELRHDTLLYVKQSYTVGTVCEFPDAYVDPYPELFARIGAFAQAGSELVAGLDFSSSSNPSAGDWFGGYFQSLGSVAAILEEMAQHQRTGTPHSQEHLDFINDVVEVQGSGSGPPSLYGWYVRLFHDPQRALEDDPIIADVHTDPGGVERPPSVLHVATGRPRLMVVTVDTCTGPRIYVGPAFAYHERVVSGSVYRLSDSEWKDEIIAVSPPDVGWMEAVIAP